MSESIQVTVVGAGTMGNGIVQTFASFGHQVTMVDQSDEALERGKDAIATSLQRFVKKERIRQEEADATLSRIHLSNQLAEGVAQADLVVEAVFEDEQVKKEIFAELDRCAPAHAILGSHTSSISITRLAAATQRPDKVIGMHFMNPVPIMKLVEVIRGDQTSDETCAQTIAWAEAIGKTCGVAHDFPGFIANRILMPMLNEAMWALHTGVGDRESIDVVMKLGCNFPMGPLALADYIGLDICKNIMDVLAEGLGRDHYAPCPLLIEMVEAGKLGVKSGSGFYEYS